MVIEYRKIGISEKQELAEVIYSVQDGLERKEFFVPFSDKEIDVMLDENIAATYGAYADGKLVGTAQFYLGDEFVDEINSDR